MTASSDKDAVILEPREIHDPVRFGEDFVLDLRAYEVRRSGRVLKLERIPMELLILLVERRGQLVSRGQIVDRIWGKDVHLDTDNSINSAIRKIRQTLRDNSEEPRVIQTVPGKGYRFIATVADIEQPRKPAPESSPPAQSGPLAASAEVPLRSRRRRLIAGAAALVLILVALGIWRAMPAKPVPPPAAPQRRMLAVLPFENLTGDASQDYLSDGLTEELIAHLGNLDPRRLGVIARTSVMHYKNSHAALDQIGRELGVQFVLEGTVRRDPDKVRVSAQLIQVSDQTHLWARQYDREPRSLLSLQGEIASEVSDEIQETLGERRTAGRPRPVSSPETYEAYDLYLRAQYFWNKRTTQGLREAIDYCQQAVATDPGYARAYAGLANSYALLGGYSGQPQSEFTSKARAAALRALELDPGLPEAHAALALIVQNSDWDWQTAEVEYRRAIELNPSYATAHHWYAEHLAFRGRFDEALAESERARRLDPLSMIIAADKAMILYYARQYDGAVTELKTVLGMDPGLGRAHSVRNAYVEQGRFEDALADIESCRQIEPAIWHWSSLAYVYGRAGRRKDADRALGRLLRLSGREAVDPATVSWAYVGIGDREKALAWLEKACVEHSSIVMTLKVEPGYDKLRGDPRFRDILRRIGLAE